MLQISHLHRALTQRKARFHANQPVRLVIGSTAVPAVICDISSGFSGVGLRSERPVAVFPGTTVKLVFLHQGQTICAKGQVRWSRGGSTLGVRVLSLTRDKQSPQAEEPGNAPGPSPESSQDDPSW